MAQTLDKTSLLYAIMHACEQANGDAGLAREAVDRLLAGPDGAALTEAAAPAAGKSDPLPLAYAVLRGQEIGAGDARTSRRAARQAALMEALERARQVPVVELRRMCPPRPGAATLTTQQIERLRRRLAMAELWRR